MCAAQMASSASWWAVFAIPGVSVPSPEAARTKNSYSGSIALTLVAASVWKPSPVKADAGSALSRRRVAGANPAPRVPVQVVTAARNDVAPTGTVLRFGDFANRNGLLLLAKDAPHVATERAAWAKGMAALLPRWRQHMHEAWSTGLSVLLGAAFLHAFYATVRLQWPESYYSLGDVTAYRLSASPLRYVAFRFGPVFLVSLFVVTTMERLELSPWLGAVGVVGTHALSTSGRAVADLFRHGAGRFNRSALVLAHAFIVTGLIVTAAISVLLRQPLAGIVPSLTEIRSDLWTALAAAILGGYVLHLAQGPSPSVSELIAASRARLPNGVWDLAEREAKKHGSDVALVRSILLVENLQRPGWLRRLERMKGTVHPAGSYGVMQVRHSSPLSDEESVVLAVERRLSGVAVPRSDYGSVDSDALERLVAEYNPDPRFVQLVVETYYELDEW